MTDQPNITNRPLDYRLHLRGMFWEAVFTFHKGTLLERGSDTAHMLLDAARRIEDEYGVYSFQRLDTGQVLYCGKFEQRRSKRKTKSPETSLQARLKNYLNGHPTQRTNLRVRALMNNLLCDTEVSLKVLRLRDIRIETASGDEFNAWRCADLRSTEYTKLVERNLIEYYRLHGQASWNKD